MDSKQLQFMQIAMKYLPEAKSILDETGLELDLSKLQPVIELLTKVMSDAYDLGRHDALEEK
ncbi:ComZ family protein [Bacillus sp. DJP31]|uniref:ComZ family protein n=1 Tax=Bacillus sp. DJP31 TaxID=3409789 RepID=UPI003BB4B3A9